MDRFNNKLHKKKKQNKKRVEFFAKLHNGSLVSLYSQQGSIKKSQKGNIFIKINLIQIKRSRREIQIEK